MHIRLLTLPASMFRVQIAELLCVADYDTLRMCCRSLRYCLPSLRGMYTSYAKRNFNESYSARVLHKVCNGADGIPLKWLHDALFNYQAHPLTLLIAETIRVHGDVPWAEEGHTTDAILFYNEFVPRTVKHNHKKKYAQCLSIVRACNTQLTQEVNSTEIPLYMDSWAFNNIPTAILTRILQDRYSHHDMMFVSTNCFAALWSLNRFRDPHAKEIHVCTDGYEEPLLVFKNLGGVQCSRSLQFLRTVEDSDTLCMLHRHGLLHTKYPKQLMMTPFARTWRYTCDDLWFLKPHNMSSLLSVIDNQRTFRTGIFIASNGREWNTTLSQTVVQCGDWMRANSFIGCLWNHSGLYLRSDAGFWWSYCSLYFLCHTAPGRKAIERSIIDKKRNIGAGLCFINTACNEMTSLTTQTYLTAEMIQLLMSTVGEKAEKQFQIISRSHVHGGRFRSCPLKNCSHVWTSVDRIIYATKHAYQLGIATAQGAFQTGTDSKTSQDIHRSLCLNPQSLLHTDFAKIMDLLDTTVGVHKRKFKMSDN